MITTVTAGLAAPHAAARPLLDRVEGQRHGRLQARRTYADGAQYLLFSDPTAGGPPPAWTPFAAITPAAVAQVQQILKEEVLPLPAAAPAPAAGPSAGPSGGPATGAGSLTWVVYTPDGEHIVQTAGGLYSQLPPFVRRLDEAVSQGVVRAD
jgi:hypothetical protein